MIFPIPRPVQNLRHPGQLRAGLPGVAGRFWIRQSRPGTRSVAGQALQLFAGVGRGGRNPGTLQACWVVIRCGFWKAGGDVSTQTHRDGTLHTFDGKPLRNFVGMFRTLSSRKAPGFTPGIGGLFWLLGVRADSVD